MRHLNSFSTQSPFSAFSAGRAHSRRRQGSDDMSGSACEWRRPPLQSGLPAATMAAAASHGRSFYQVKVSHETMYIDKRYQKLSYIGGGAYGFVCAATDMVRVKLSPPGHWQA